MHLYPIDGAASRVPADATAFAYRDGGWAGVIVGVDPDAASRGQFTEWARDYWAELHPTSAGGAYINFMMAEGEDRIRASYRGNYDRLAQVKRRYDPANAGHVDRGRGRAASGRADGARRLGQAGQDLRLAGAVAGDVGELDLLIAAHH